MKKIILPILYLGIIGIMVFGVVLVLSGVKSYVNEDVSYKYTVDNVFMSDVINVVSEVNDSFVKPYISDKVNIKRYFYNKDDESDRKEKSLIYYENTYIQNKGVDYTSSEAFDIVSVCDGEVVNIEESELYGTILTIKHNDNLVTLYSNLTNVLLSVGNTVSQGEIIGVSTNSKFDENEYMLHFEVKSNGNNIDPESIFTLNISNFN